MRSSTAARTISTAPRDRRRLCSGKADLTRSEQFSAPSDEGLPSESGLPASRQTPPLRFLVPCPPGRLQASLRLAHFSDALGMAKSVKGAIRAEEKMIPKTVVLWISLLAGCASAQ